MDAFGFSATEMNGVWILLILILLLAIGPRIYINYTYQNPVGIHEDQADLNAWAASVEEALAIRTEEIEAKKTKYTYPEKKYAKPNSDKSFSAVKGGSNASSGNSTYSGVASEPGSYTFPKKEKWKPKFNEDNKLNLNVATADDLESIKGIGPVLAERILKYRNSLGGFSTTNQLNEIYGLKPEVIEHLLQITDTDDKLSPIHINTDSLKLLFVHPYIDYKLAQVIVNYRHVHGDYARKEDLLELKLMTDSLYQKLYPYISVSQ